MLVESGQQGKLLEQFEILIHLRMNDPHIQSAACLQDIIPHYEDDKAFNQREIAVTHDGLSKFLQHFVNNHLSLLRFVGLDLSLNKEQRQIAITKNKPVSVFTATSTSKSQVIPKNTIQYCTCNRETIATCH